MNSVPLEKITAAAQYVAALADLQDAIRREPADNPKIAAMAIALVQQTPNFLAAPIQMAIAILDCIRSGPMTNAEIAEKIGRSPESVRQAIAALKTGGLELQESSAGTFRATGRPHVLRQYRTAEPLFILAEQAQREAAEAGSFEQMMQCIIKAYRYEIAAANIVNAAYPNTLEREVEFWEDAIADATAAIAENKKVLELSYKCQTFEQGQILLETALADFVRRQQPGFALYMRNANWWADVAY